MKKMPRVMPEYKIARLDSKPFAVTPAISMHYIKCFFQVAYLNRTLYDIHISFSASGESMVRYQAAFRYSLLGLNI